ncbi:hypothetical protein OPQ81_009896 [Rhizoctonia solani]|nr:hypothetical protein OPQ81_009896 [Rhizoctonia solani]
MSVLKPPPLGYAALALFLLISSFRIAMFFNPEILAQRDSGIGLLWMAATLGKTSISKLNRRNVLSANIAKLCELVAEPAEPLALRLSSNLLVGVVRVYKLKHDIFISEVTTCFTSLKRTILEIDAAETSAAINLTSGSVRRVINAHI